MKIQTPFIFLFLILQSSFCIAGTPVTVECTSYGPGCASDSVGGGTKDAMGNSIQGHRLEDNPDLVTAAVPQSGGNSNMFGCKGVVSVGGGAQNSISARQFKVQMTDHYGTGSNGKMKMDIARACNGPDNQGLGQCTVDVTECPNGMFGSRSDVPPSDGMYRNMYSMDKK